MRDYRGVHEAIREFDWSQEAQNLVAAFSGMSFQAISYVIISVRLSQTIILVFNTPFMYVFCQFWKIIFVIAYQKE